MTGLRSGCPGFDIHQNRIFFLCHNVHVGCEAHSAVYPSGTGVISSGVKRPGRESNRLPVYISEAKGKFSSAVENKNYNVLIRLFFL